MKLPFESLFARRGQTWPLSRLKSWSDMGIGDGPTKAGVSISEATAEGIPTVFSCVRVIANAVAQLPCKLYRLAPDGTKSEARDAPLWDVLHSLANPEMTSFDFRVLLTSHLLLWGNAYARIERNARGDVTALWPLLPWMMHADRDDRRRLRFTYGGETYLYDPAQPPILRLMIHSLGGICGRSPVRVLRESMGLALALQQFGATFFGNGSSFGGVLSSDDDLDDDQAQAIRTRIETYHKGANKAHRFLVLGNGFEYSPIGIPPEDAQFLESRKFQRSELCGAYGVPPHMVADLERATFSNVENESLRWLRDGLDPHLVNWESAIRRDCLGPRAYDRYYARFTRAAAVRGDLKSRSDALAIQRQNGIISANEWRALEDLDPISEADGGNAYVVSSQSRPAADAGSNG